MGKRINLSVLSLLMVISVFSQNTESMFSRNTKSITDFGYVEAVHRKSVNYDYRSVQDDEGREVLMEVAPNSGAYAGIVVGADYFATNLSPVIGGEIGYHGRRFLFSGTITFGYDKYNKESDKAGKRYLTTNFQGQLGVRVFDLPSKYLHQREVWAFGTYGYKVRQNYNILASDAYEGELKVDVKGSTMMVGVGVEFVFKNYMKMSNWSLKAQVYTGHEYYIEGSRLKLGASISVGHNFVFGKKMKNKKAIRELFGTEEAYDRAVRESFCK